MYQFINHRFEQNGSDLVIVLYLDINHVEFSRELNGDNQGQPNSDIETSARNYIHSKFPNLKKATVKVMAGTMLVTSLAFGAGASLAGAQEAESTAKYSDVTKGAYYSEAAEILSEKGIVEGVGGGKFAPNQDITKAEVAMMLARALDLDVSQTTGDPVFEDVTGGWYYGAVAALQDKEVVEGYQNKFNPNEPITRAELAKMIVASFDNLTPDPNANLPFTDVKDDAWYKGHVATLYNLGITQGVGGNKFAPDTPTTRAETATLIHRAINVNLFGNPDGKAEIEAVTDTTVTINGKDFQLADNVKGIFNAANSGVLEDAVVYVSTDKDDVVYKIRYLELNSSGTDTATAESPIAGHLVLDGNNVTIDGPLIVKGDYLTIKNVTVNGDLTVEGSVENSLSLEGIEVTGNTIFNGTSTDAVAAAATGTVQTTGKITIKDSALNNVVMNKTNFAIDSNSVIPQLIIGAGVSNIEINGTVTNLEINSTAPLTINGQATIDNLKVTNNNDLTIGIDGTISNVEIPTGKTAADVIKNYDTVKNKIENINNETNADYDVPGEESGMDTGGETGTDTGVDPGTDTGGEGSTAPADTTAPVLTTVTPTDGTDVALEAGQNLILTIDAQDDNLRELEVDHNIAGLPEFSVYADEANPYGTDDLRTQFEAQGVSVTYSTDTQTWTIDFGETVTNTIINNGGNATFYLVLKDEAGNSFGSMDPTDETNTFSYTVTRSADSATQ
ncbi:S-layer homology domain-containing protein [Ornithinibacillus scapharcae]|uniref:S-layer homology domain-containing protein n=1 Tax=Ornithinibacillus scapharcae TaxID=1147159 RepID=UPI000225BAB1|nr:S-layer homology domain-containing protein [Ornithinibacillus scapharcae]